MIPLKLKARIEAEAEGHEKGGHNYAFIEGAEFAYQLVMEQAEKLAGVMEHALFLGYVGDGSTKGSFKDVLAEWNEFIKEKNE